MTIPELIQKMKNSHFETALLEMWLTEIKEKRHNVICLNDSYYKIYGFIWGLYTTGFITEDEKHDLINELHNKDNDLINELRKKLQ